MKKSTMIMLFVIAMLLILLSLVYPVRADIGRSIYDGTWTIYYTNCTGKLFVFEDAKVTEANDIWLTIVYDNGKEETKLPLRSNCAEIRMDRKR